MFVYAHFQKYNHYDIWEVIYTTNIRIWLLGILFRFQIPMFFYGKIQWQIFLLLYGRHGHQHGVSIQSSINLGETLFRITREWITTHCRSNHGQVFYMSIIFNIPPASWLNLFIKWFLFFFFNFWWRDTANQSFLEVSLNRLVNPR